MQTPASGFIEIARDQVAELEEEQSQTLLDQDKELESAIGSDFNMDVATGYRIGLQTARVIISTSAAIQGAGIKATDIL